MEFAAFPPDELVRAAAASAHYCARLPTPGARRLTSGARRLTSGARLLTSGARLLTSVLLP